MAPDVEEILRRELQHVHGEVVANFVCGPGSTTTDPTAILKPTGDDRYELAC